MKFGVQDLGFRVITAPISWDSHGPEQGIPHLGIRALPLRLTEPEGYIDHNLNSLKGVLKGTTMRVLKWDTRR